MAICKNCIHKQVCFDFGVDTYEVENCDIYVTTADVQEVRHGYWKGYTRSAFHSVDEIGNPVYRDVNVWQCSECNRKSVIKENYCPCCGARMDGKDGE